VILDESGALTSSFQVVYEFTLLGCQNNAVVHRLILALKCKNILKERHLKLLHIAHLILGKLLDEPLETFSCLSLCRLGPSTKERSNTILENLVDKVLVTKGFFLFCVLSDDTHNLTETVRIVNRHFHPCQGLHVFEQ
jgi:hypothetical protein